MDIRSLLNDRELAAPLKLPVSDVRFDSLNAGRNDSCSWQEADAKNARSNLRALLCNDNGVAVRKDSMSAYSPKSGKPRRLDDFDVLPKSLPCYQCHKLFTRRSDLVRHERIHSGVRPHKCPYPGCGKSFIQRSALTIHERVHTGDKPHECQQCGKPFSDSSSLARHRRTHTGVRPYRCDFPGCGKDFTRKTTLSRHRQQHTVKGHVPANSTKAPSTSTLSTVSSFDDLRTPNTISGPPSPTLMHKQYQHQHQQLQHQQLQHQQLQQQQQQPAQMQRQSNSSTGSCYITFQVNPQSDERYMDHAQRDPFQQHSDPRSFDTSSYRSTSCVDEIGPNTQLPLPGSLRYLHVVPRGAPAPAVATMSAEHLQPHNSHYSGRDGECGPHRQRPAFSHSRTDSGVYAGSPLPRIMTGWSGERMQFAPLQSGSEYGCGDRRERRDSVMGRAR